MDEEFTNVSMEKIPALKPAFKKDGAYFSVVKCESRCLLIEPGIRNRDCR